MTVTQDLDIWTLIVNASVVVKVVRIFDLCKAGDGVCPPAK